MSETYEYTFSSTVRTRMSIVSRLWYLGAAVASVLIFAVAPAHAATVNYDLLIESPELLVPSVQLNFTAPSYLVPGDSYTFTQYDLGLDGMGPLLAFGPDFTLSLTSSNTPGVDVVSLGKLALMDIVGDMYDAASFEQFTIPDQSPGDGGGTVEVHYMFIGGAFDVTTNFTLQVSPNVTSVDPTTAVPEPGIFALCTSAIGVAAWWSRRHGGSPPVC